MKGVELLFRYNPIKSKNICIKKCMHICKIKASQFDSYALAEIVAFSNCLLSRYPKTILPVV